MELKTYMPLVVLVLFIAGAFLIGFVVYDGDSIQPDSTNDSEQSMEQEEKHRNTTSGTEWEDTVGTEKRPNKSTTTSSSLDDRTNFDQYPTQKRYVNAHRFNTSPDWVPEDNVSLQNTDVRAYEVTRYPNVQPTEEHLDSAWELYNESYEAAKERGFFDFNSSLDDGYQKHDPYHFFNEEYYFNDENLNPREPEGLVYFENYTDDVEGDRILAGYVYWVDSMETEGEQVAGPLTTWHYHPQDQKRCFASRLGKGFEFERRDCSEDDVMKYRSPEMIHVWFIQHPEGPFSTTMGSYDWATGVFDELNNSGGVPEKMSEEKFKTYAETRYEKYFMAE